MVLNNSNNAVYKYRCMWTVDLNSTTKWSWTSAAFSVNYYFYCRHLQKLTWCYVFGGELNGTVWKCASVNCPLECFCSSSEKGWMWWVYKNVKHLFYMEKLQWKQTSFTGCVHNVLLWISFFFLVWKWPINGNGPLSRNDMSSTLFTNPLQHLGVIPAIKMFIPKLVLWWSISEETRKGRMQFLSRRELCRCRIVTCSCTVNWRFCTYMGLYITFTHWVWESLQTLWGDCDQWQRCDSFIWRHFFNGSLKK